MARPMTEKKPAQAIQISSSPSCAFSGVSEMLLLDGITYIL